MPHPHLPLPARRQADDRRHANRIAPPRPDGARGAAVRGVARVTNVAPDTAELMIYGEIGRYYGVSAESVIEKLNAITAPKLTVRINSGGGDVFESAAIYNAIRRHPAEKTAAVDGLAASCASWIALAADRVVMGTGSYMMVHNAWMVTMGEAAELRRDADILEKLSRNIAGIYAARTGDPLDRWVELMDAETWFTGAEAVAAKLADDESDAIASPLDPEDPAAAAANAIDLSAFAHVPGELRPRANGPRDVEDALRDAGLSRTEAKAAVSHLRDEARRDAAAADDADVWAGIREFADGLASLTQSRKEH